MSKMVGSPWRDGRRGVAVRRRGRARSRDGKGAKEGHSVDAEVVASDAEKMTITVKVAGVEKTAAVSTLAKSRLSKVKAGDKVILSCKDVDGGHREVVAIRPARAEPAKQ